MDRTDSRAKVWPLHQFGGGDNFEEYDVDKDTWLIDKAQRHEILIPYF